MDTAPADAITALDTARAALRPTASRARDAVCGVLAALYPEAAYVTVHLVCGHARIGDAFRADGRLEAGPTRRDRPVYPTHLVGKWPLARLPKRAARPHLGAHADDRQRCLDDLLTDAWRSGAQLHKGCIGRLYTTYLKLR